MNSAKKLNKDSLLRKITSYASIGVAFTLIIVKLGAYYTTGSVALLSSLVDSGVDLFASLITAYGVIVAMRPPDREYRFGHGKAEALAALAQAIFITLSALALLHEAFGRFMQPTTIQNTDIGYRVMIVAIILTLALLLLQSYTIAKTKSLAIASDRLHYIGDIFVNGAVIITFALQSHFNMLWLDPFFALIIAAILIIGAIKIYKASLRVLMDAEIPLAKRQNIIDLMSQVEGVMGVHDVRTREASGTIIIEAHIEMDAKLSLLKAHKITEAVERIVKKQYKKADITIHQDPFGHKEKRLDNIIAKNDPA